MVGPPAARFGASPVALVGGFAFAAVSLGPLLVAEVRDLPGWGRVSAPTCRG